MQHAMANPAQMMNMIQTIRMQNPQMAAAMMNQFMMYQ
jgi:hypothetical protein